MRYGSEVIEPSLRICLVFLSLLEQPRACIQPQDSPFGKHTEHILELQTIPMFMEHVVKLHPQLESFFMNHWTQRVGQLSKIRNRKPRPPYKLGTQPPRDSLNSLVFEALGSTENPTNFVLCSKEINTFKEHLWANKNLMGLNV
ncbi:hypothetical protein DPSP01_002900 [Paraphaeosphaeria sporulosa]